MFDLVERTLGLSRDVGQADPHQRGAGNMVSLDARLAALATLKARELLELAMRYCHVVGMLPEMRRQLQI